MGPHWEGSEKSANGAEISKNFWRMGPSQQTSAENGAGNGKSVAQWGGNSWLGRGAAKQHTEGCLVDHKPDHLCPVHRRVECEPQEGLACPGRGEAPFWGAALSERFGHIWKESRGEEPNEWED